MFVIGNFKHNIVELPEQSISKIEKNGIRLYSTPEGIFPSVTSVVGWEKNKKFANWRENNKSESKRVCDRGNNLHSINNRTDDCNFFSYRHILQCTKLDGTPRRIKRYPEIKFDNW